MAVDPKKIAQMAADGLDSIADKQKESVRLQKEYNDALQFSVSINGQILADIDSQVDYRTKLGKKAKEYLGELKSGVNELQSSEDIAKELVFIEAEKVRIARTYVGANRELGQVYLGALNASEEMLNIEQQRLAATEKVRDVANDMVNSLTSGIDSMTSGLSEIPLVGGMLSKVASIGGDAIKNKLGSAAKGFVTNFRGGLDGGMSTMGALRGAAPALGKSLIAAFTSPLVIIGLVVAALAMGIKRFSEIDKAAQQFRDTTGLLNSQTKGLQSTISSVSVEYANLGATAEDVGKAASSFVTAFDGIQQPAKATVESLIIMNKNFGVGFDEASKVNKVMQNLGGLTEAQAASMSMSVVEMSKLAGVAPQQVMKDIADNSANALKYFRGSPKELAKSAVSLAAMGSSLESAAKSSESLLDFESSIANELEASAMLGADINLEKARAAAFNGDIYGQEKAIMEQMMKVGDINKMDMYSKEALAKATGKSVEELVNMQRIQKQFGNLDEGRLAAAHALMDAGKDITQISAADLDLQNKKMASQKDMQSQMDNLSNSAGALSTGFMDMLAPLGAFLIPIITDLSDMLGSILLPAFTAIGSALRIIGGVLGVIWNLFMAILKPIFAITGAIMEGLTAPLNMVADALDPLFAKFGELKDKIMEGIAPILPVFSFIGTLLGTVIGGAIDVLVGAFSVLFDFVFGGIDMISGFLQTYLVEPIMSFISTIQSGWEMVKGFFGMGGEEAGGGGATQSVDDGVMQNGQVISTDPADFLIASKNPSALAGQMAGGGDGGGTAALVSSLIAEMQGMRADLAAGKIAVNIDGQKMNAKIAANAVRNPIS
jgi:hypothetical protein